MMITEKDIEIRTTGAVDFTEDPRDYTVETHKEDFIDAISVEKFEYNPDTITIKDQWNTPFCVGYATTSSINNYKSYAYRNKTPKLRMDDKRLELDGSDYQLMYSIPFDRVEQWRTIISWLSQARHWRFIKEYIRLKTVEEVEQALDWWLQLSLSISHWTRNEINSRNPFLRINKYNNYLWHNVLWVKKEYKNWYTAVLWENSRWAGRWLDWFFYIKLDEIFEVCRQVYAIVDNTSLSYEENIANSAIYQAIGMMWRYRDYWTNRQKRTMQAMANMWRHWWQTALDNPVTLSIDEQIKILDNEFR